MPGIRLFRDIGIVLLIISIVGYIMPLEDFYYGINDWLLALFIGGIILSIIYLGFYSFYTGKFKR